VAEKIDRKQLKRPDEFQVVAGRAMGWVAAHQRLVLGLAAAVVAVVLTAWGVSAWRGSRESKASAELAEALELLSRPVAGEGQAQPGEQTFPSKEEREKAVVAALEKVRSDHGNTAAGQTALAELGFHKLKSGDAAAAQKDLEEFLAAHLLHTHGSDPIEAVSRQDFAFPHFTSQFLSPPATTFRTSTCRSKFR